MNLKNEDSIKDIAVILNGECLFQTTTWTNSFNYRKVTGILITFSRLFRADRSFDYRRMLST
jgi:hypothetical protein